MGGLTWFVTRQVTRDRTLVDARTVKNVEWHFFVSDVSKRVGPSEKVMQALIDAGIPFHVHLPVG